MIYYIKEKQMANYIKKTAGVKARDDLEYIFSHLGISELPIPTFGIRREKQSLLAKIKSHFVIANTWKKSLKNLKYNDALVIQFPIIEHTVFISHVLGHLKKKNIKMILFIHDLELIRRGKKNTPLHTKMRINIEEKQCLQMADYIVGHNEKMNSYLSEIGVASDKLIPLIIFDYILETNSQINQGRFSLNKPVVIGGNLRKHKAGYVYDLPEKCKFNLYGVGYAGKSKGNIKYFGSFDPDELPQIIEGSFGLVWDGMSSKTCEGVYGNYLKINNPHKTSLYIASGIPVIIWEEAALAKYITDKHLGITIKSIDDIPRVLKTMSEDEYNDMLLNVKREGEKIRTGYYTELSLSKCGILNYGSMKRTIEK